MKKKTANTIMWILLICTLLSLGWIISFTIVVYFPHLIMV